MMEMINLTLGIQNRTFVANLNGWIRPEECWCVMGRNGVGKSTLLRTLAGIHQPDQGTIRWQGKALFQWSWSELARTRSFLPQKNNDVSGYRVRDVMCAARYPYHAQRYWETEADHQYVESALRTMEVMDLIDRDLGTLSGGERQRVAMAALLAQDTELLLLDEPTAGLDLGHQMNIISVLMDLCQIKQKSIVMVSHDLNWVHSVATHVLFLLGEGKWRAGPVDEMMRPAFLSQCMGYPIEKIQQGTRHFFIPAVLS